MDQDDKYFLPYQHHWINDTSPLKIFQKSRQIGITYADAYHSVRIASRMNARFDVYISSRDKFQARLYIEDCKNWAQILEILVLDLGEVVFDQEHNASAYVLQFSNGKRIYSLSSNPNALAGKSIGAGRYEKRPAPQSGARQTTGLGGASPAGQGASLLQLLPSSGLPGEDRSCLTEQGLL